MFKFFKKIAGVLAGKLKRVFSKPLSEETLEELEEILYEADLGSTCVSECIERIRKTKKASIEEMRAWAHEVLSVPPKVTPEEKGSPHVILMVGINGSGKTTTCAKLALHYKRQGKKVLLAAGDTFRAAAVEQLEIWAERTGVEIVKGRHGGDPSAVLFDAVAKAKAGGYDMVIADTAGRLESKSDLMKELEKMRRVAAPQETILVIDATLGQSAVEQAKIFNASAPLTGIALTKMDGSSKGGVVLAIYREMGIPIQWVGIGEGDKDLHPFAIDSYLDDLLG
ncbi:MAG: signal recognition particle-docking protein FtsY [Simkaniaceae bacterium]|nr:signal recognition particle-docking protein FtsY [Simkaniaceae bacterium]